MPDIIITKPLLDTIQACDEIIDAIDQNNLWNQPVDDVLRSLRNMGHLEATLWWRAQKDREIFVRATGRIVTMNEKWKVFNPLNGIHEEFTDISLAKARLQEIGTEIVHKYTPHMITEIINENGDGTWISTDEHLKLVVTFKD